MFNKALNKTMLFLLDRKFVSTSRNEEFVKKTFLFNGETVPTAWNIRLMGKTVIQLARKTVSTGTNDIFL